MMLAINNPVTSFILLEEERVIGCRLVSLILKNFQ